MPELKTYDLFISHVWRYSNDYSRLVELLNNAPLFKWRNYSVPEHDPAIDPGKESGHKQLLEALDKQVRPVNCVLIASGMYAAHSYWIQQEIKLAQRYGKPIVGVAPWGQERIPQAVQDAALEMVHWRTDSIVSAIRKWSL